MFILSDADSLEGRDKEMGVFAVKEVLIGTSEVVVDSVLDDELVRSREQTLFTLDRTLTGGHEFKTNFSFPSD